MNVEETRCEDREWIELAQDKPQWRVVVNMVMNFMVA
jgi:hypothetical protein